ncbi:hypothetical protein ACEYYA_12820 [Paracoccus sp. p3-h83]|uniref:hypothetical protein n=1 Tax=Paracoccus sp. p3-h83 TaxID=3342805 RepID=UPI0035BB69D5
MPGYINTTSTRESTFRPGFAGESVRVLMYVGMKIEPEQRLAAQAIGFPKLLESLDFGLIT